MKRILLVSAATAGFNWDLLQANQVSPVSSEMSADYYFGVDNREFDLTFRHCLEGRSDQSMVETQARELIGEQLRFLPGALMAQKPSFASREEFQISNIEIKTEGPRNQVCYQYDGLIVGRSDFSDANIEFPLPSIGSTSRRKIERRLDECSDLKGHGAEESIYYWNPQSPQCWMKLGRDFEMVAGNLHPRPNSRKSYPQYDRLVDQGEIRMDVFLGAFPEMDGLLGSSAMENGDNEFEAWLNTSKLEQDSKLWTLSDFDQYFPDENFPMLPKVLEYSRQGKKAKIRVRVVFGYVGLDDSRSKAFHYFYKDALENAAVVTYFGHSGVGKNLDLEAIEEMENFQIEIDPDQYQIFELDGCRSYAYYADSYQARKTPGRADIITNGLPADSFKTNSFAKNLLAAIARWDRNGYKTSYQQLLIFLPGGVLKGVNEGE